MMNLNLKNADLLRVAAFDDGRIYLTQGFFDGRKIIRFQVGQFDTTRDDVMMAHAVIQEVW